MNEQLAAVEDMRVSLEMLVGLRTEADSLHERALAAADRRDEAAQALIKRLALQVTRLEAQVRELHERERMFEDALFSQAKDAPDTSSSEDDSDETSGSESDQSSSASDTSSSSSEEEEEEDEEQEQEQEIKEKKKDDEKEKKRETDVGAAPLKTVPHTPGNEAGIKARTPGSIKKSPALAHVPLQSAPAPERTSIALPPQSPLTAPNSSSSSTSSSNNTSNSTEEGSGDRVRVAQLERIVKCYEELTGVTVQPGPDPARELQSPRFACTAVDCSAQRAVQFQLLFGERSVEYTPTRIDVPADLTLSEEVTEAIEFSSTLTPIFLVKLIDELNSTVVPE